MRVSFPALLAAASCLGLGAALAAVDSWKGGSWSFGFESRGHPELIYSKNDKNVFYVGCGHAFGLHAVYPGTPKKAGTEATVTIANRKTKMSFKGSVEESFENDPPNTMHFLQWDLGFSRQDPGLYGDEWKRLEARFFDLLDSGQPLTVSAENRHYELPAVNAGDWKKRFKDAC